MLKAAEADVSRSDYVLRKARIAMESATFRIPTARLAVIWFAILRTAAWLRRRRESRSATLHQNGATSRSWWTRRRRSV